ncbi:MAG: ribbon-helix-helix protein, CopG family [Pseudomonadota bacterium]
MGTLSLRLPEEIEQRLAEEARLAKAPRSEIARQAIAEYLVRQEKERFIAEVVAAAKAIAANENARHESVELAEEFLPLENEALDIAEGRKSGEPWPEEFGEKWWK